MDTQMYLSYTREEKDELARQKMEAMRKKNEEIMKRHAEVEADKRTADELSSTVIPKKKVSPQTEVVKTERRSAHNLNLNTPISIGRGRRLKQEQNASVPPPPPDPTFSFLSDPSRDRPLPSEDDKRQGSRRHHSNFGGHDFENVKVTLKQNRDFNKEHPLNPPKNKMEMSLQMTGKERREYQEWKLERQSIDEQRIARQKKNSGEWRREWDMDKIVQEEDKEKLPSQYYRDASWASKEDDHWGQNKQKYLAKDQGRFHGRGENNQSLRNERPGSGRFNQRGNSRGRGGRTTFWSDRGERDSLNTRNSILSSTDNSGDPSYSSNRSVSMLSEELTISIKNESVNKTSTIESNMQATDSENTFQEYRQRGFQEGTNITRGGSNRGRRGNSGSAFVQKDRNMSHKGREYWRESTESDQVHSSNVNNNDDDDGVWGSNKKKQTTNESYANDRSDNRWDNKEDYWDFSSRQIKRQFSNQDAEHHNRNAQSNLKYKTSSNQSAFNKSNQRSNYSSETKEFNQSRTEIKPFTKNLRSQNYEDTSLEVSQPKKSSKIYDSGWDMPESQNSFKSDNRGREITKSNKNSRTAGMNNIPASTSVSKTSTGWENISQSNEYDQSSSSGWENKSQSNEYGQSSSSGWENISQSNEFSHSCASGWDCAQSENKSLYSDDIKKNEQSVSSLDHSQSKDKTKTSVAVTQKEISSSHFKPYKDNNIAYSKGACDDYKPEEGEQVDDFEGNDDSWEDVTTSGGESISEQGEETLQDANKTFNFQSSSNAAHESGHVISTPSSSCYENPNISVTISEENVKVVVCDSTTMKEKIDSHSKEDPYLHEVENSSTGGIQEAQYNNQYIQGCLPQTAVLPPVESEYQMKVNDKDLKEQIVKNEFDAPGKDFSKDKESEIAFSKSFDIKNEQDSFEQQSESQESYFLATSTHKVTAEEDLEKEIMLNYEEVELTDEFADCLDKGSLEDSCEAEERIEGLRDDGVKNTEFLSIDSDSCCSPEVSNKSEICLPEQNVKADLSLSITNSSIRNQMIEKTDYLSEKDIIKNAQSQEPSAISETEVLLKTNFSECSNDSESCQEQSLNLLIKSSDQNEESEIKSKLNLEEEQEIQIRETVKILVASIIFQIEESENLNVECNSFSTNLKEVNEKSELLLNPPSDENEQTKSHVCDKEDSLNLESAKYSNREQISEVISDICEKIEEISAVSHTQEEEKYMVENKTSGIVEKTFDGNEFVKETVMISVMSNEKGFEDKSNDKADPITSAQEKDVCESNESKHDIEHQYDEQMIPGIEVKCIMDNKSELHFKNSLKSEENSSEVFSKDTS